MNIVVRRGAGVNTVEVNGHVFDLNRMSASAQHQFRRELTGGLRKLWGTEE